MALTSALTRPALVSPRAAEQLEAVRSLTGGGFDVDAWHVMDRRDDELVAEEILNGSASNAFVYQFDIKGTPVTGISVVGAKHLAAHYRGLKHRLVASQQKSGSLFVFTSYPAENMPMSVSCAVVHELAEEPDFYSAVVELTDIKTGNSIQIERREDRFAFDRGGNQYERPNYTTIAQSKALRNAILSLVPQDIVILWKEQMLKLRKGETIAGGVIAEKRSNVLRFAAQYALPIERRALDQLTLDQIAGLGDAAREGRLPAFVNAARALNLIEPEQQPEHQQQEEEQKPATTTQTTTTTTRRPRQARQQQQEDTGTTGGTGGPPPGHPAAGPPQGEPIDQQQQDKPAAPTTGLRFDE